MFSGGESIRLPKSQHRRAVPRAKNPEQNRVLSGKLNDQSDASGKTSAIKKSTPQKS
jgi:hypothetical protein